jgi:hypothetical protein
MTPKKPQRTHRDLLPKDVCPALMMKHILTGDIDAAVFDDRAWPGDGYFWCLNTCTPVGPDDELVNPGRCRAGRSCWEGIES